VRQTDHAGDDSPGCAAAEDRGEWGVNKGAKDFRRWKACLRKVRYPSLFAAKVAAVKYAQDWYACATCKKFHLKTKPEHAIRKRV